MFRDMDTPTEWRNYLCGIKEQEIRHLGYNFFKENAGTKIEIQLKYRTREDVINERDVYIEINDIFKNSVDVYPKWLQKGIYLLFIYL